MSTSAAIADSLLRRAGSPLVPSTYGLSTPRDLTAPRARLTMRLRDFVPRLCSGPWACRTATNRH